MAISAGLNIAFSGLEANKTALDVTSNNISNASNPDYVRERAVFSTLPAIHQIPGDIGTGVKISTINRITDTFLFNRFTNASANLNALKIQEEYLKEIGTYFPDVNDQGLYKDMQNFFNAWQTFASNPNDGSVKVTLANTTENLTDTFHSLINELTNIKKSINGEIDARIKEANSIIKNIALLNKKITLYEANGESHANELRDKRDALVKRLREIINIKVFKNGVSAKNSQGAVTVDYAKNYQIMLGGYPLVDGSTTHEIQEINQNGNINIGIATNDNNIVNITPNINDSEIGSLLKIRGTKFDNNGTPLNGTIGNLIKSLNNLAATLIKNVNSIYSYSAQPQAVGIQTFKPVSITPSMLNTPMNQLYQEGVLAHNVRNGILTLDLFNNEGKQITTLQVSIKNTDTINNVLKKINDKINSYNNNFDVQVVIKNGEIKFVPATPNGNGEPNPQGSILVKDDGSLMFSALKEYEYLPINQINNKLPLQLQNGGFDINVYDNNGNIIAKRHITIDLNSNNPRYNTIQGIIDQINTRDIDDNHDNNPNDDVDDYYHASILNGKVILNKKTDQNTYIGLDNDESNFGGVFGINQFFEGNNATTISLSQNLKNHPGLIHAYKAPNQGNNTVANEILQLQYKTLNFNNGTNATLFEYYRQTTTNLADTINNVMNKTETAQTLYKSISNEYYSLSGVNIDNELINLEKYQRGYQANARVISAINSMLDALFNIKQ